jgi:hypothetical protein
LEQPNGYKVLHVGQFAVVMINSSVMSRIVKDATDEQLAGLRDLVERYADGGWPSVPKSKFNPAEGWFPSPKDKRVRLEAFKPWQLRAYGFCEQFQGKRTFFITGADCSKKQDRANQTRIATAGNEAVRLHDELKKTGGFHVPRR